MYKKNLEEQKLKNNDKWRGILDKNVKKFVDQLESKNDPLIYTLKIDDAREVLNKLQIDTDYNPAVKIEDFMIPDKEQNISVRIIKPEKTNKLLPAIIYYHGGGFILGNKNTHHRLICELALGVNAAVVFLNYTPAPEAKFPVQLQQAYKTLLYIYENGKKHDIDSSKIVLAGDSVGGYMAAVTSLLSKQKKQNIILAQVLFYPMTDIHMDTDSYNKFAEGPWLTAKAMQWFIDAYLEENRELNNQKNNILISPLITTIELLKGLPPALIITDENDVLRDEGEAYAHKLMKAEVDVVAVRYLGTIHDFLMLKPLKDVPSTRSAIDLAVMYMRRVFYK